MVSDCDVGTKSRAAHIGVKRQRKAQTTLYFDQPIMPTKCCCYNYNSKMKPMWLTPPVDGSRRIPPPKTNQTLRESVGVGDRETSLFRTGRSTDRPTAELGVKGNHQTATLRERCEWTTPIPSASPSRLQSIPTRLRESCRYRMIQWSQLAKASSPNLVVSF